MEDRNVIAVDGLAGSGKTALSRLLAGKLDYVHLSTGLVYRALGWLALENGVGFEDTPGLLDLLKTHEVEFRSDGKASAALYIDGQRCGPKIHLPEVSEAASVTSRHLAVREALLELQRQAFPGQNIVAEGRDMGTVVFPTARVKFFIQASQEMRIERRLLQLQSELRISNGDTLNSLKKQIEMEILDRDERDSKRLISPTVAAPDAIIIDNSRQTLTEVVQNMYDAVLKRLG